MEKGAHHGWHVTTLTDTARATHKDVLEALDGAIKGWRQTDREVIDAIKGEDPDMGAELEDEAARREEAWRKAKLRRVVVVCACEAPRKLTLSRSVFAQGPIECGLCGTAFYDPNPPSEEDIEEDAPQAIRAMLWDSQRRLSASRA